jgi:hypothetical protein
MHARSRQSLIGCNNRRSVMQKGQVVPNMLRLCIVGGLGPPGDCRTFSFIITVELPRHSVIG